PAPTDTSSSSSSSASTQPAARGVAETSASSSSAAAHTHRVQSGETYSSISIAAYGSPRFYPAIMKANPGIDPAHLKVGMTINLPDASSVKGATASPAGAQTASAGDAQQSSAKI